MCGISGLSARPGELVAADLLRKMAGSMHHRGPDAEGTFAFKNVGLAHRRLKIIDLSDQANQPLFNEDGKVAIVFNGEIYNFQELREDLGGRGHVFKTMSDTEVIVHAFEQWGEDAFRRLNGIFAFGLCDLRAGSPVLYLVRDRFGTKPLLYTQREGRMAFASELKPLLEVPWIPRIVDRRMLFYFLKFSHVPAPHSILADVRQVRPGTWLRFDGDEGREGVYWDPIEISRVPDQTGRSEEDWLDELEDLMRRVVKRQRVSDVPLGCLLSGGIDSSLLTMACASSNGSPIETFSIGYRETEFDETPYAREVAEAFGTRHRELIVGPEDLRGLIADVPTFFDQPFADPTLLPSLLLAKFARERVTVALSGDGGDELFFGYTHHQALYHLRRVAGLPAGLRRAVFAAADGLLGILPTQALGLAVQQARKASQILQFRDEAELFSYFIGTIGPMRLDRLAEIVVEKPDLSRPFFEGILQELHGLPWQEKIDQIFLRSFLPDTVLAKTDRAGMAYGLEARVPFLDDEMVAFSARLPFEFKFRGGTKKYLLRRLLARRLPGRISRRSKQGFSIPLREWFRGELKYLLDEHLDETRLGREGYFEPRAVRRLVDEHLGKRANHSHLLWSLVSFQMWQARYLR